MSEFRRYAAALLALAGIAALVVRQQPDRLPLPQLVLWAWERPEDLRFLNPRKAGVAFLASTLALHGARVDVRPRLQPLAVPRGTALMAVVRIEPDQAEPPELTPAQAQAAAAAIARTARLPGVVAVQVDFDARVSERAFYGEVLRDLRRALPPGFPVSITALASWCLGDNWIEGLPIDEAVPMVFRMGVDTRHVNSYLVAGRDFRPTLCRSSIGIATDEAPPLFPAGRRLYVFHPRSWSPEAYRKAAALR